MRWLIRSAFLGILVGLPGGELPAEVIVAYESLNPVGGVAAGQVADGVVALALSRGPGIERASGSSFNTRGWSTTTTVEADAFIEWGWSNSSRLIDLETLDFRYDRSTSGPKQVDLQLAINDLPFESIFCDPAVSVSGEDHLGIDLSNFDNVESAVFRLYGFDAASASGTFDLENFTTSPNQAVMVSGTVSSVPEPSALSMLGSIAGGFFCVRCLRRRRVSEPALFNIC